MILSDILQSGQDENELYQHVASLLKEKNITHLIGIGEAIITGLSVSAVMASRPDLVFGYRGAKKNLEIRQS